MAQGCSTRGHASIRLLLWNGLPDAMGAITGGRVAQGCAVVQSCDSRAFRLLTAVGVCRDTRWGIPQGGWWRRWTGVQSRSHASNFHRGEDGAGGRSAEVISVDLIDTGLPNVTNEDLARLSDNILHLSCSAASL